MVGVVFQSVLRCRSFVANCICVSASSMHWSGVIVPLCLCAPVTVCWYLELAKCIAFCTIFLVRLWVRLCETRYDRVAETCCAHHDESRRGEKSVCGCSTDDLECQSGFERVPKYDRVHRVPYHMRSEVIADVYALLTKAERDNRTADIARAIYKRGQGPEVR